MTAEQDSTRAPIDSERGRAVLEETMRLMTSGGKVDRDLWKDFVQVHNQGFTHFGPPWKRGKDNFGKTP